MGTESTVYDLKIQGQDQVEAGWKKVADAAKQSGEATSAAGAKLDEVGAKGEAAAPRIQQFGSVIGLAARGVGELNPHLGQMVSVIGNATGAIGAMEAALGPLGLAIGIATTAFTLIEQAVEAFDDQQKRTADNIHNQIIPALDDIIAKSRQASAQLTLRSRLSRGGGTSEEQAGFTQEAVEYVRAQRDRMNAARAAGNDLEGDAHERELHRAEEVVAYRERLETQARQREDAAAIVSAQQVEQARARAALDAQIEEAQGAGLIGRNTSGGGSRGPSAASRQSSREGRARLEGEMNDWAREEQDAQSALASIGQMERDLSDKRQADADRQRAQEEADGRAREARLAKIAAAEDREHQRHMQQIAQEIQQRQALADAITTGLGAVGELAATVAKNEQEGIKIKAGFEGAMEVVKAAVDEAAAISYFADLNFVSGAAKQASAIAHAVAAGKAFAIAGGGGGGSASAGGGAGGGGTPRSPDTGAGRGGGPLTINILGPMIAAGDKSSVGRIVGDSIRSAITRHGARADGLPA